MQCLHMQLDTWSIHLPIQANARYITSHHMLIITEKERKRIYLQTPFQTLQREKQKASKTSSAVPLVMMPHMPLDCLSSRGLADPVGVSVPAARRAVAPAFVTPTLVTPPVVAPRLSRLGRGTARFLRWCRARGDFWRTARCCGRYGVGEAGGGWGGDGFRGPGASWGRGWRCCLGTVAWRRTLLANTLELSHGRG